MIDLITIGESLGLLRAASPDTVEMASALRLGVAGAESNVAIGASRLGLGVAWHGRIGDDDIGRRVVRELRAEGVRVDAIHDTVPTALLIKETPALGPARVRYYRENGPGSRLRPEDLPTPLIERAKMLHVTGITASLSPSAESTLTRALDIASTGDTVVSFDVNHRATLPRHREAADIYRDIARRSTIVFAGEDEALLLVPEARDAVELLEGIAALGPSEAVLKLGADGCIALIDGVVHTQAAVPVTVVDTVGAGDSFVAGYLAERARGSLAAERLRIAALCGAMTCTHPGDWEGAPRRGDLASVQDDADPVLR